MPPRQRASIIAANLLAPAGVLLFGWNVATAVFLILLDTVLVSLTLGGLIFAAVKPQFTPSAEHPDAWAGLAGFGAMLAGLLFLIPVLIGVHLYDSLRQQFPQGPFAAAFASKIVFLGIALDIVLRGIQVGRRAREILYQPDAGPSFLPQAGYQLIGLALRMLILFLLVWTSPLFGHYGLIAFLIAASAFLAWNELHEDWVARVCRWAEAKLKG